jgi:hypothetical protein
MEFKKLIVGESFYNRLGVGFRLCNQAARMSPRGGTVPKPRPPASISEARTGGGRSEVKDIRLNVQIDSPGFASTPKPRG